MIEIRIVWNGQSEIRSLSIQGHAGFSDSEHGGDIVCSAVSALAGFLGIAFSEILADAGVVSADDGLFSLELVAGHARRPEVRTVLDTWVRAVEQLEENYSGWVKVESKLDETRVQM